MGDLPSGTVTFLFTDIEGSTRLWQERPDDMRSGLEQHDEIVRGSIENNGGYVFATGGDGFAAAFASAGEALAAAEEAQTSLGNHEFIAVRMGLHTGEAHERGGDYFGPAVNKAARLMAAGHGGQVLASDGTVGVIGTDGLIDLGTHQLRDLGAPQRVFQVGVGNFAPLRTVDAFPTNLPTQLDSFIGRGSEMTHVVEQLESHRLVTLTGVGGVGKTRLALQVAAELLPKFEQGCWLVDLAPVRDGAAVPAEIAQGLGVSERPGEPPLTTLLLKLKEQSRLVVLDNCEHLLDQVAEAAEAILGSCPQISMVATSREGLAVRGEQVIPVPSLRSHAADLFTARAEEVSPGFGANAETAEVEALCARLDGLPLAIELAAARTRTLTTAEILERLDQSFRLLRGGRRQVERHQTIRATVEWSYDLLGDPEKVTFNRLSVFAGWFTAADAEAVVADGEVIEDFDVLEHLDSLVSKSMVQSDTTGSVGRFRLLETLRQFAAEQLQEAGEDLKVRDRHAARFEALIRHWQERLYSGDFASALSKLESLSDEASAAMDWLLESGDVDLAGQIYVNGRMIFVSEQLDDSMRRSEQITNRVDEMSPENQVTVLGQACWAAFNQSDFANGVKWGEKAVAIADAEGLGFPPSVGTGLPTALSFTGQPDRALEVARLALEAATSQANSQTGRPEELVIAMMSVSSAALAESPAEAVDLGRTGLAMAIELGGAIWIASAQTTLARALSLTDPVEALRYAREAVEGGVYPNLRLSANALAAWLEAANGNAAAASARIAVGLALFEDLGRHYMYLAFLDSAALTYSDADPHTAALLLGARSTFQAQIGLEGTPYERHVHDKALAEVKGRLSNKDFEAAFAEGAELDLEEALGLVGEITERAESASSVQG